MECAPGGKTVRCAQLTQAVPSTRGGRLMWARARAKLGARALAGGVAGSQTLRLRGNFACVAAACAASGACTRDGSDRTRDTRTYGGPRGVCCCRRGRPSAQRRGVSRVLARVGSGARATERRQTRARDRSLEILQAVIPCRRHCHSRPPSSSSPAQHRALCDAAARHPHLNRCSQQRANGSLRGVQRRDVLPPRRAHCPGSFDATAPPASSCYTEESR